MSEFDFFLSYNRSDADAVEELAANLFSSGVKIYKDDWYLQPGQHWPTTLEKYIGDCKGILVAISGNGIGPWQRREIALAIQRQELDAKALQPETPVIPVLLDEGGREHAGLGLISQNVWVENWDPRAIELIVGALDSRAPIELYGIEHPDPRTLICPYRGLHAFREEDVDFYFGREPETERLISAIEQHPVIAVVGASGSGKSSLVRAGLTPHLRKQKGRDVWQIATIDHPGIDPFRAMARALLPLWEPKRSIEWSKNNADREATMLSESLYKRGASRLLEVVSEIFEEEPGTNHLLIFIDQWEELYTEMPTAARTFVEMILLAAQNSFINVVLTVRADFWGEILCHYPPLANRLAGDAAVHIASMEAEALRAVISKPAKQTNISIEPALVEKLAYDAEGQSGDMPLLEFALYELWQERRLNNGPLTLELYEAIGGLESSIVQYAEKEVYSRLTPEEQEALPGLFFHLFQPSEQGDQRRDLRRQARLSELGVHGQSVARKLAMKRLLVTSRDWASEYDLVEVSHEALLRHWPRVLEYRKEWSDAGLIRRRLERDVRAWIARGKDNSYRWPHEQVLEAADTLRAYSSHWIPSEEVLEFLGPMDTESMLLEIEKKTTSHSKRLFIGDRLAIFGDPRIGVGSRHGLPDIKWIHVPGGTVEIEIREDPDNSDSQLVSSEVREVNPFYIAQYPVTCVQYALFQEECCSNGKWTFLDNSHLLNDIQKPMVMEAASPANRPRDFVSWFDAVAFSLWLSERTGLEVRLPTESEWQIAAIGVNSTRRYPWAKDWDPITEPWRANTIESSLGSSTAVGLYPDGQSIYGALDMSGTIWEWCSTLYETNDDNFLSSNQPRVRRGGSWSLEHKYAGSMARYRGYPFYRIGFVGFRVACTSLPTDTCK